MATKSTATGVNTCPTTSQGVIASTSNKNTINAVGTMGGRSSSGNVASTVVAAGSMEKSTKAHANTVLLKSVSAFLASSKRNSSSQSKASEISLKTARRLKKDKMDELSGKINPKLLEHLRKKTRFNK